MLQCTYKGCRRPGYGGSDKCIFHAERKIPQEFRNALARQIRQWRNEKTDTWDFSGWVFVDINRRPCQKKVPLECSNMFAHAVFAQKALFVRALFLQDIMFDSARFIGHVSFAEAKFKSTVSFHGTRFCRNVWFNEVNFLGDALFLGTEFPNGAWFVSATFSKGAWFESATFGSTLLMLYTSFSVVGDFTNVIIAGHVQLEWPGLGHRRNDRGEILKLGLLFIDNPRFVKGSDGQEPLLDLRNNWLQNDCRLCISKTKMQQVLLDGTDCRRIEFGKVMWPRWKGRQVVGDEFIAREHPELNDEPVDWGTLAITYQQLTDRFRKDLNHPVANDFERGIFESRLMEAKQKDEHGKRAWRTFFLLSLYKAASNFSGSITRPALWTLLLTIISGLFYGHLLYGGHWTWPWQTELPLVFKSGAAALRIVTLDRGLIIREIGATAGNEAKLFWVSLVAAFQIIVTAILITLLIFSVRRRFKHTE